MSETKVTARPGLYADSVTLMQVSQTVAGAAGVEAALIAMATELNLDLARTMGFVAPDGAGPDDLLVAVRASTDADLDAALAFADERLAARPRPGGDARPDRAPPRTVGRAAEIAGTGLVLVSVPGPHAFTEAMDALDAGCDVLVFSDNVAVEHEIRLKDVAAERDLLVMGPDCGTAVIGGVGLGFANVVEPGPVGVVAASGTGAQQLMCLLDAAAVGVSAVLGVGGRDLSAPVSGRSTRAALDALDADPATDLIVVVSKPPDPSVAQELREHASELATPVRFAMIGPGQPDLSATAGDVVDALGHEPARWPAWPGRAPVPARGSAPAPGALRGLFAGGTLCDEAMAIASSHGLGPIGSNIPLPGAPRVDPSARASGHVMLDFGDDALTTGRPHPMIDSSARLARFTSEAADPAVAVILLDVVLGHGAHADPAAGLAPAIHAGLADRAELTVVCTLVGSRRDPQDLNRQAAQLQRAGAHVYTSNAEATRFAVSLIGAA